jgi:choline dehydrogenase-like flavoprotein
MDHPSLLTWGLMPEDVGQYRGPISTSGIEDLRGGPFRSVHSAFRIEVGNDGWSWPAAAPNTTLSDAVTRMNLFGRRLREFIARTVSRQFRLGILIEQLPNTTNRVTIDPQWVDALGNYRPVITYNIDDYSLDGMSAANRVAAEIFRRAGIEDCTDPNNGINEVISWKGQQFAWGGAGHFAGTHIMGTSANNSVVDSHQRTWEHDNLYAIGCGSMPTMGTSNPTLTLTALTFRTARDIIRRLQ